MQAINKTSGRMLAKQVFKANNFFSRLRGLLFSPQLEIGQALLIVPCSSIHCIGMSYPIDAIFLDKKQVVVGLLEELKPWQVSAIYWGAHSCLELPSGTIKDNGIVLGDQLVID